jgi:hypothetical protein
MRVSRVFFIFVLFNPRANEVSPGLTRVGLAALLEYVLFYYEGFGDRAEVCGNTDEIHTGREVGNVNLGL